MIGRNSERRRIAAQNDVTLEYIEQVQCQIEHVLRVWDLEFVSAETVEHVSIFLGASLPLTVSGLVLEFLTCEVKSSSLGKRNK